MNTSDYVRMASLSTTTHICETQAGMTVLALARNSVRHFYHQGNGYPLSESELELVENCDIDEVHIHVEDCDEMYQFDARSYSDAERFDYGWGPNASVPVEAAL